jgi:hypothetical protein
MNSLEKDRRSRFSPVAAQQAHPNELRLEVVRQLLTDLDTITVAGQHFTMDKVIGLLEREVAAAEMALSELQRRGLRRALADLGREHGRQLPDVDVFVVRARMIADTLSVA